MRTFVCEFQIFFLTFIYSEFLLFFHAKCSTSRANARNEMWKTLNFLTTSSEYICRLVYDWKQLFFAQMNSQKAKERD